MPNRFEPRRAGLRIPASGAGGLLIPPQTARRFDGVDDALTGAAPAMGGAFTLAAMLRRTRTGTADLALVLLNGSSQSVQSLGFNTGNKLESRINGSTNRADPGPTVGPTDGWVICVITKASGTATPRFHVYRDTVGWTHNDAGGTQGDPGNGPVVNWTISNLIIAFYPLDFAMAGIWDGTALSDGNVEALTTTGRVTSNWTALSPSVVLEFDQPSSTDTVIDLALTSSTPHRYDSSAVQGTTVITDGPSWAYDQRVPVAGPVLDLVWDLEAGSAAVDGPVLDLLWDMDAEDGGPAIEPLSITPPDTTGYTTYTITQAESELETASWIMVDLDDATDYVIVAPYVIRRAVLIRGGRNIVWIAGHIQIEKNNLWFPGGEFRQAMRFLDGDTATDRIIHIEGVWANGMDLDKALALNVPTADVQIGHWLCQDNGSRSSDAAGATTINQTTAVNDGNNMYQGVSHWHSDVLKTNGPYKSLTIDRATFRTAGVGLHWDAGPDSINRIKRVNVKAGAKPQLEEGPLGDADQSWTLNTNQVSFEASQGGWTTTVGGSTITYPYTTSPLAGSQSAQVTRASTVAGFIGIGRSAGSQQDWTDSGASNAIGCLFRLDAGGGHHPMARIDVSTTTLAAMGSDYYWHLGQSQPVELGVTTQIVCEFPDEVLGDWRKMRIVLITDTESTTHTFTVDNIASGDGSMSPTFDGPTDIVREGKWAFYHADRTVSEDDAGMVYMDFFYAEVSENNAWKRSGSSGNGTDYSHRYWDYDLDAYVLDPPPGDATFQDFFYPSPAVVDGAYVEWSSTVGPKLRNGSDSGPARAFPGPPPDGDYVDSTIAGLAYEPAGYYTEVDGAALDLTWDTAAEVSSPVTELIWDTAAEVSANSLELIWDAVTEVNGAPSQLKWDLIAEVNGAVIELIWDLIAEVNGASQELIWDLIAETNSPVTELIWDLYTTVDGGAQELIWDLSSEVNGAVTELIWDLTAAVDGGVLDLVWDTIAQVNSPVTELIWDLIAEINGNELDIVWDLEAVGAVNGVPLDLTWDVIAQVAGAETDLKWDLYAQVDGAVLDLLWDLISQVNGASTELIWDLAAQINGGVLDLTWDLRTQVDGAAQELIWDLVAQIAALLRLKWDLIAGLVTFIDYDGVLSLTLDQPSTSQVTLGAPTSAVALDAPDTSSVGLDSSNNELSVDGSVSAVTLDDVTSELDVDESEVRELEVIQ